MPHPKLSDLASQEWENEGGGLPPVPDIEALGITRLMTETYLVDGYRYTTLADAVAQANRRDRIGAS